MQFLVKSVSHYVRCRTGFMTTQMFNNPSSYEPVLLSMARQVSKVRWTSTLRNLLVKPVLPALLCRQTEFFFWPPIFSAEIISQSIVVPRVVWDCRHEDPYFKLIVLWSKEIKDVDFNKFRWFVLTSFKNWLNWHSAVIACVTGTRGRRKAMKIFTHAMTYTWHLISPANIHPSEIKVDFLLPQMHAYGLHSISSLLTSTISLNRAVLGNLLLKATYEVKANSERTDKLKYGQSKKCCWRRNRSAVARRAKAFGVANRSHCIYPPAITVLQFKLYDV